jgi:hypothetical protein
MRITSSPAIIRSALIWLNCKQGNTSFALSGFRARSRPAKLDLHQFVIGGIPYFATATYEALGIMEEIGNWLTQTPLHDFLSDTTHTATWLIIPVSQTIHILAVSVIMICVAILNLTLLGIGGRRETFGKRVSDLTPWIWSALTVLLATGILQTLAEPNRELLSMAFRLKLLLVLAVVAITAVYQRSVREDLNYWWRSREREQLATGLGTLSLVLWLGIAAAGRLIAYVI